MKVENQAGNSFDSSVGGLLQWSQHSTPHIRSFAPTIHLEAHAKSLARSQVITQKWRISIATTGIPSGTGRTRRGNDGGLGLRFMESSPGTCRLSPHVKNFWCKYWRYLWLSALTISGVNYQDKFTVGFAVLGQGSSTSGQTHPDYLLGSYAV